MESIASLIEAFGGVTKFGRAIGKRCEHVGSMRARNSIPSRYWIDLVESVRGRELGLSLDDLARLNAKCEADQNAAALIAGGHVVEASQ